MTPLAGLLRSFGRTVASTGRRSDPPGTPAHAMQGVAVAAAGGFPFGAPPLPPPIVRDGFFTFPLGVEGDQKLIVQLHRAKNAIDGALLRIKSSADPRPPLEAPIPAVPPFAPALRALERGRVRIGLGGLNGEVRVEYAAGRRVYRYHAINPNNPFGPLRMNREFPERFLEALAFHRGGFERYSFETKTALPDEAIAAPKWQFYVHPGLGPSYRALTGRYQGRSVTIDETEVATVKAIEEGMVEGAIMLVTLPIYAHRVLGPLLLIGQAVAGRTITGEKLSVEGRVIYGLLALLPFAARAAGGAAAEAAAVRELAAARGISEAEAATLIRGARLLSQEERAFLEAAERRLRTGGRLTADEARRVAKLVERIGGQTDVIFSAANDIELIDVSQRYWGMTEGAVYGARMPVETFAQRLRAMIGKKEGLVIFQGDAARLFHAHEIEGGYSALKRLLGQHKAGFGDIVFDQAVKEGNVIIVTRAHIATAAEIQHMGQSTAWATARLWGRRLGIEPFATAAIPSTGVAVYMLFDWLTDED